MWQDESLLSKNFFVTVGPREIQLIIKQNKTFSNFKISSTSNLIWFCFPLIEVKTFLNLSTMVKTFSSLYQTELLFHFSEKSQCKHHNGDLFCPLIGQQQCRVLQAQERKAESTINGRLSLSKPPSTNPGQVAKLVKSVIRIPTVVVAG